MRISSSRASLGAFDHLGVKYDQTPEPRIESAPGSGALVGIVLGLTAVICLMLLAFSTPAIHSGPHDLPLAVSGPEPAVAQLRTTLDENRPDAFAVKVHATSDDVASAIKERAAVAESRSLQMGSRSRSHPLLVPPTSPSCATSAPGSRPRDSL